MARSETTCPTTPTRQVLPAGKDRRVQTAPRLAVVSTGYANQWGFPSPPVRETLESLRIPLLDTGLCGQIILHWNNNGDFLEPECARAQNPDD